MLKQIECRHFEITLCSAQYLEKVQTKHKMEVYAVASFANRQSKVKRRTPVDRHNEANPVWNCTFGFLVDEKMLNEGKLELRVRLKCKVTFGRDRLVGEVLIPLHDLLVSRTGERSEMVLNKSAYTGGSLQFRFLFGEVQVLERSLLKRLLTGVGKTLVMVLIRVGIDSIMPGGSVFVGFI